MDNTVERCAGKFDYNFSSNSNKNDAKNCQIFSYVELIEHIIKLTSE